MKVYIVYDPDDNEILSVFNNLKEAQRLIEETYEGDESIELTGWAYDKEQDIFYLRGSVIYYYPRHRKTVKEPIIPDNEFPRIEVYEVKGDSHAPNLLSHLG